jgi:hypothetical protein
MALLFTLLICVISGMLYDPALYSLDTNLVTNPTFSSPALGGSMTGFYGTSISGWSCTVNCQVVNIPVMCTNFGLSCANNYTQGIDLDSQGVFELVRQSIAISTVGDYLLTVEYMCAVTNPIGKTFRVTFNGTIVNDVTCPTADYGYLKTESIVSLVAGNVNVSTQMYGTITGDNKGMVIAGVYLRRLVAISGTNSTTTNNTTNSTANSTANSTTNSTTNGTTNSTVNSTTNSTANSTTNSTANSTTNSTINQTTNSTSNSTTNNTANSTSNQTLNSTTDSTSSFTSQST